MRTSWTALGCAALLPVLAACGGGGGAGASGVVVTDSAGVRIVQSDRPAWKDGGEWTVEDAPSLDIGVLDGEAAYQLDGVRSVARLSDGRILVGSSGSSDLRLFGPNGRHLASTGREGGGPGEFRGLQWAGVGAGDTLLAWDAREKRLSVFSPEGALVRTVQPQGPRGQFPLVAGVLADGSIVATDGISADGFKMGEYRESVPYHRFATDGRALGELGRFAGMEAFVMRMDRVILQDHVLFGRDGGVQPAGRELLVTDSDRYEVRFLGLDRTLRRIVRRPHEPVRVKPSDVEAYFAARDGEAVEAGAAQTSVRRMRERQREVLPRRETFPAYGDARTDADGNLWVEQYPRPREVQPRWDVFDREGRWLAAVATPAGLKVHLVGPDWILGVATDEAGVEHVRLHLLEKPRSR